MSERTTERTNHHPRAAPGTARASAAGTANGIPVALILALARESLRFIVSSDTRKARAICGVVRPTTALLPAE